MKDEGRETVSEPRWRRRGRKKDRGRQREDRLAGMKMKSNQKLILPLTVADSFARHVVAGREAVFGHGHVRVEGERQQAGGRLDLRGDLGPAVPTNQGSHCGDINQTDVIIHAVLYFYFGEVSKVTLKYF